MSRGLVLLLAAFMVAGCVGATVDAPDSTPKAIRGRAVAPAAMAAYLHNLSEPDAAIRVANGVLTNFKIGGSDGVKLDAWIVRPKSEGKYPLVLEVTPYYSGGSPIPPQGLGSHAFGRIADILVPRGYAYGIMSVRGTGNSEGCFTVMGAAEGKTTAAAIEALAKQPWSNGNVGLVGVSYPGTTPQDAWVEAPPALKTIIPISGISDLYKYSYVNGVHINQQGYAWTNGYSVRAGTLQYPTSWAASMPFTDPLGLPGTVVGEACPEIVPFHAGAGQTAVTANKDAFWTERDLVKELKKVGEKPRPSVFYIHGLQDWNVKPHMMEDWLAALQESGVPLKIWLGQWQHAWPAGQTCSTGPCRADWWEGALVAWLDQFLKGVDTGVLDGPAVQVQDDDGVWRHEPVWPPADATWRTWFPSAPGALLDAGPGQGKASYVDERRPTTPAGTADQVVFRSEPVSDAMHVSGLPRFEGNVTASGRRASLILTLAEEKADGTRRSFNFAALSLNHAKDPANGATDIAGLRQRVGVNFFPQDDVVHVGSRLILIASGGIVGGPGPGLLPLRDGSVITLDLEGSALTLPIDESIVPEVPAPYGGK